MKKFRVYLVERVKYIVDVEAEDEEQAATIAEETWCASENPTDDFNGEGQGVYCTGVDEDPPNWDGGS